MHHPESLLARLLLHDRHYECGFLWEHPHIRSLPETLRTTIWHAGNFSETIHGAALLYNLMMAHARGVQEWAQYYEERLSEWVSLVDGRWEELTDWHREVNTFWSLPALVMATIPHRTECSSTNG